MAPPKPPRPSIRKFLADEMSTSRGKRLALERALGVAAPQIGPPEVKKSPLVQQLDTLRAAGARAELSRFLLSQSAELERSARTDLASGQALLRAYEEMALDDAYAEQALVWAGRAGKDAELLKALASGDEAALRDRVMTRIIAPAVPRLAKSLEARFQGRTAQARKAGALERIFKPFDAKSAFAAAAKLRPR